MWTAQSGIHGWGLFARKAMKADSMVIEYRGDVLRRTTADAREKRYQAAGKDCYLFTVQDDFVVDATMRGGIGRFTVRPLGSRESRRFEWDPLIISSLMPLAAWCHHYLETFLALHMWTRLQKKFHSSNANLSVLHAMICPRVWVVCYLQAAFLHVAFHPAALVHMRCPSYLAAS